MKVKELVEKYEKNSRINIAKEIETKPYIGIMQKKQIAELVLDNCMYFVDDEIHMDSVERYILFTITVIQAHTNLEFDYENDAAVDDYDMLCETGLLVKIIDTFQDDYASCQEILNMVTGDRLQDSMTIEKKLYQFLDGVKYSLDEILDSFVEKINFDELQNLPVDKNTLLSLSNIFEQK